MPDHVAYWTELLNAGTAVAFGAVADPSEAWLISIGRLFHLLEPLVIGR
jgi:hypothetical protein